MSAPTDIDPSHCPLCGLTNQCAMEVEKETGMKQPPCWCMDVDFSRELLASLPAQAQGRACICRECADRSQPGGPAA